MRSKERNKNRIGRIQSALAHIDKEIAKTKTEVSYPACTAEDLPIRNLEYYAGIQMRRSSLPIEMPTPP